MLLENAVVSLTLDSVKQPRTITLPGFDKWGHTVVESVFHIFDELLTKCFTF